MEQLNHHTPSAEQIAEEAKLEDFNKTYKKRLTRFIIRESLSIGFVYWFWDKPWMKYLLFIWVPLVLFNLFLYINWHKIVASKKSKIEKKYQG